MTSPLSGKRVLVTRAREQAATFTKLIEEREGISIEIPLISFEPRKLNSLQLSEFSWILFTSANGVRFFLKQVSIFLLRFAISSSVAFVQKVTFAP